MLIAGALAFPVAVRAAAAPFQATGAIKALSWAGKADVATDKGPLLLEVETRVEPFVRARSRSWLRGRPETARTMLIEPEGGFVERGATRSALPAPQAEHERQQYALYGYMLRALADTAGDLRDRRYQEGGLPPIDFHRGSEGLGTADYTVSGPDGSKIAQRILFEGAIADQGVRWPRAITILQNDKPFFKLALDRFLVERA